MSFAYFALIVCLVSASALDIAGAKFGVQLGMTATALGLLAAVFSARKVDYEHYLRATVWGRWILIGIPLCIAAQLVPLGLSWAHPIWASSHDALGGPSLGPVTADLGLTLNALFQALAAISLLSVTIVVVRDRSRAELVLFVLSGVTAVSALTLDLHPLSSALATAVPSDLATSMAGLGVMLNLAVMQLAAERAETRHSVVRSVAIGLCGLVGALTSAVAVFLAWPGRTARSRRPLASC
ncbi:magnesium-transporting ATPase (P-type) [Bradyrhizobium sp. F1.13.1]